MIEQVFAADVQKLPDVMAFAEGHLAAANCTARMQMAIAVALEEIFVNIAHYAYPNGTGSVRIAFDFDENSRTVSLCLADQGIPFNPLEKPAPDITLPAEERPIGGLGILITIKTMDEVSYRYENGENILTMRKKI